jgi:hypothetical protein
MTEHEDTRVLSLVLGGQIGHRETALKNIAKEVRQAANILQDVGAEAGRLAIDAERSAFGPALAQAFEAIVKAQAYYQGVKEAETTIGNIENLSRGRMKFFGQSALPKGPSNVTQLPRSSESAKKASGSTSPTRAKQGADNPGRERQRQRRQSQND